MSNPSDAPPDDPFDDLPPADRQQNDESRLRNLVPEFVRKVAVAGLGAVFMTEEGIRSLAGQMKLPKEALGLIIGQAERTKEEIGKVVSEELRRFLQSDKMRDEFLKLIAGMTVEIKAEVRLVPDRVRAEAAGVSAILPEVKIDELKTKYGAPKKKKGKDEE
jgi:hypothetical protein